MAAACIAGATVSAVLITAWLDQRGLRTPFPLMEVLLFRNLARYRAATLEETGKVGPLFYGFVISINAALILVLAALLVRAL